MERFSSRFGFLLAAVGAAVGLGNIWRFPAVVGQIGGGAYLLPYLLAAFVFAVPLLSLSYSLVFTGWVLAFPVGGVRVLDPMDGSVGADALPSRLRRGRDAQR